MRTNPRVFLVPLLFSALACGGGPRTDAEPRNVVFLLVDTLRADRMSLYGYDRPTTPRLEEFARSAVTFDAAYSPSSWTRASVASYFTGLHPSVHGAEGRESILDAAHETLAERFAAKGYATVGFYANYNVIGKRGFAQGFDRYEHPDFNAGYPGEKQVTDAAAMNDSVLRWLRDERPAEPWFLFVFYMDPHAPYLPHPEHEFGTALSIPTREGSLSYLDGLDARRDNAWLEKQRDRVRDLYDGEIAYVDRHLGEVLDALDSEGLAEDTVVVLSADHGEGLWEHEYYRGHGLQVYQPQIHVPLVVRWPGRSQPGLRVSTPTAVMDVFGSLVDAYQLGAPAQAGSILPDLAGTPTVDPVFVEQKLDGVSYRVLVDAHWKLVRDDVEEQSWLYDLRSNPGERRAGFDLQPADRLPSMVQVLEALSAANLAWREGIRLTGGTTEMSPEEEEGLRALGYIK